MIRNISFFFCAKKGEKINQRVAFLHFMRGSFSFWIQLFLFCFDGEDLCELITYIYKILNKSNFFPESLFIFLNNK